MLEMHQSLTQQAKSNKTIDDIIQHRIGYGYGQLKIIHSLNYLIFAQGCQTIVLGLLLPKIGSQWQLDKFDKSLLITLVYVGVSIGSYLQTLSDKYGRYKFLLFDSILVSIFGLLSCICTSFSLFAVVRFFYGIGIGIALPLSSIYITQVIPALHRANVLRINRTYWAFGCIFTCIMGWLFLANNHWRILLFILCFPSFYALYDIFVNGRQTLRYLWVKRQLKQFGQIVNEIAFQNKVSKIRQQDLLQISNLQNRVDEQKTGSLMILFNEKYLTQTLILVYSWTSTCFLYYATMLMIPSILSRNVQFSHNFQYIFLIIMSAVQIFSILLANYIMDHPQYGRKRSIYLGYILMFIVSVVITIFGQTNGAVLLSSFIIFKISLSISFFIMYPYTAQIYETLVRSQAMGIFSTCGRVATTVLGIIGISALEWADGRGLYYIFVFLTLTTAVLIYQMPYCTLGRKLDS